ncbi:MAG: hypothetical protein AAF518_28355 [Spirochaetota bacterium]
MKTETTSQILEEHAIKNVSHFQGTRADASPQSRLENVRRASLNFREELLSNSKSVKYYKTVDLVRVPYPTKYGLLNASTVITPYMHILNRLFIVRYQSDSGLKTLLFSPSDIYNNVETPFFKRLSTMAGPFSSYLNSFLAPVISTVEDALKAVGIKPEEIDFISYDHLHTQDIRKWLGSKSKPGYFPNAKLLVMRQEWESAHALLPPQQDWYCPNGLDGVPMEKVILLDSDVILGDGVALVTSQGHTEGNHSLVVHTDEGLLVSSENGVSPDCYSPTHSAIPGVKDYAEKTGMEVILNGNTLEAGLDQYISMVKEKTIAGPSKRNPDFYNVVPSSELTPYWGFPGLEPTFTFGPLEFGSVR